MKTLGLIGGMSWESTAIYYRLMNEMVRERLGSMFPDAVLGRWHDRPVGPHPQAMYQVAFAPERLATLLPWLMLNRFGLTILLHPETGDDYADHSRHAVWLGEILPLRLEALKGSR